MRHLFILAALWAQPRLAAAQQVGLKLYVFYVDASVGTTGERDRINPTMRKRMGDLMDSVKNLQNADVIVMLASNKADTNNIIFLGPEGVADFDNVYGSHTRARPLNKAAEINRLRLAIFKQVRKKLDGDRRYAWLNFNLFMPNSAVEQMYRSYSVLASLIDEMCSTEEYATRHTVTIHTPGLEKDDEMKLTKLASFYQDPNQEPVGYASDMPRFIVYP